MRAGARCRKWRGNLGELQTEIDPGLGRKRGQSQATSCCCVVTVVRCATPHPHRRTARELAARRRVPSRLRRAPRYRRAESFNCFGRFGNCLSESDHWLITPDTSQRPCLDPRIAELPLDRSTTPSNLIGAALANPPWAECRDQKDLNEEGSSPLPWKPDCGEGSDRLTAVIAVAFGSKQAGRRTRFQS
jgi:hypothetical protein